MQAVYGNKGGTLNTDYVAFNFTRMEPTSYQQESASIHIGPDVQRAAQRGLFKVKLASWAGGLNTKPSVQLIEEAIDTYSWNPGIQTRFRGAATLPYKLNTAGSFTSDEDISGAVAANVRAHDVLSSLGSSGERLYTAMNHKVYRPTSLSDPTPEVCYTTTTSTDEITCMAELVVNGTKYLAIATNGATNDVEYVADPTGTWSGNMTTLVALSAGDYITAMAYLPTVGPGVNILVGKVGGVNGVWWMDTSTAAPWTLNPCVLTGTKDEIGGLATVTTSEFSPSAGSNEGFGYQGEDASSNGLGVWTTTANITAEDTSYAQYTVRTGDNTATPVETNGSGLSSYLVASYAVTDTVPKASRLTGAAVSVRVKTTDSASDGNAYLTEAYLTVKGSAVGHSRSVGTNIGATEEDNDMGSSTDPWGASISGDDWETLGFKVRFLVETSADNSSDDVSVDVDHIGLTITYRPLGDTIAFPLGGYMINRNPVFPNRISVVTPTEDEISTILKPRELWHLDFDWQSDQERPTFTFSQPNEGARYVWHATPHLGGYLMAVGYNAADRGILLKHSDASGNLRDFNFFGTHDTYIARINQIISHGSWAVLDVYYENSGGSVVDRQWVWLSPSGKYYTDFLMQSYSNHTIAAQPIPHSTSLIEAHQHTIRTFYPNSTTTAAAWQFIPPDPALDPRANYQSEVLTMRWTGTSGSRTEDTALEIRGAKMDVGHEEANKTLLELAYHGNRITAGSGAAHGSVTLEVEEDGGDFSTPSVSNEFTTAYSTYNVPTSGLKYTYLQFQTKFMHDAGSAETPDGLSFLITTYQQWVAERRFVLYANSFNTNLWQFISGMENVQALGPAQPLYIGANGGPYPGTTNNPAVLCAFEDFLWQREPLTEGELLNNPLPNGKEVGLVFITKPGTV